MADDANVLAADPNGAWSSSLLGAAIGAYVDRTMNAPQQIAPQSNYGMDASGNLYRLGQPNNYATMTPVSSGGGAPGGNGMLLLMLVVGFVVMEKG